MTQTFREWTTDMPTSRMKVEDLKPEYQTGAARIPSLNLERSIWRGLINFIFKASAKKPDDPTVSMTVHQLGNAQARVFEPQNKSGAGLVWIHGGGMIMGTPAVNDNDCTKYARELGAVVVSVGYRLAPKHPYPAAIDDCYTVWSWFLSQADKLGVDPERIAISGQSAGGGLSAALCQRIKDEGDVQPAAQCLFYPMLDDRTATNESLTAIQHIGWNNRSNRFGWSAYLGQPAGGPDAPKWSVPGRREDLSGLPKAWIGVGDKDLFFDENKAYAERLIDAGVPCELILVEGVPHGFDMMVEDAPASQDFLESAMTFLKTSLGVSPP